METRTITLGHLQRGGSPTPFDRLLGTRFGVEAVRLVARGGFSRMVALRGTEIVDVPIAAAIDHPKVVEADGELVRVARCLGVSLGA
jgi:6-phosphofructokinase 1